MEKQDIIAALSALAQESRLRMFRLLVTVGPVGMSAGQIADDLAIPPNTLSFHLSHLKNAGLVAARREGRSLIYAAEYAHMRSVIDYLTENCCSRMGTPVIDEIPASDPDLIAMLAQANLPTEDLAEADIRLFRFSEAGQTIGYIGWETVAATHVLLRSAVVAPARRGQGHGRQIILWALNRLAELRVTDVWLLTTSMEKLARRLGFTPTDRTQAPEGIRRSHQFTRLCPSTAVLLHKRLP